MSFVSCKCVTTEINGVKVYIFPMKVKDVLSIYYVAVRGQNDEQGAVQRVLNKKRISSIREFILKGNVFFNTFILNWTESAFSPQYDETAGTISVPISNAAAQVIDGQHRLAGLQAAVEKDDTIAEKELVISLCINLSTEVAAKTFLNINYEQRPIPKSLVYDLFGLLGDEANKGVNRANDIAEELNDNSDSPYYKIVKFPGTPRGVGLIDLSTVVSSLKVHLENEGVFSKYNLSNLDNQKQVILNYLNAIRYYYDKKDSLWLNKQKNPFLTNAGFYGAIDFLTSTLLARCVEKRSFSVETIKNMLNLDEIDLLLKEDIKNLDGKSSRKSITAFLEQSVLQEVPEQGEYEF